MAQVTPSLVVYMDHHGTHLSKTSWGAGVIEPLKPLCIACAERWDPRKNVNTSRGHKASPFFTQTLHGIVIVTYNGWVIFIRLREVERSLHVRTP